MKRSFYTVNGLIIGERTSVGRINYATDALGSVTGTLVGAQLQNTYTYKPYGTLLAKTGTGSDPKQGWLGSLGYRPTGRTQSDYYVRARHLGAAAGRWTTVDRHWPWQPAYGYVRSAPSTFVDYTGAQPSRTGGAPSLPTTINCDTPTNDAIYQYCYWCHSMGGNRVDPQCQQKCDNAASQYYNNCYNQHKGGKPKHTPGPGEHWVPIPGAGIAPVPQPPQWTTPPRDIAPGQPRQGTTCPQPVEPEDCANVIKRESPQPVNRYKACVGCCDEWWGSDYDKTHRRWWFDPDTTIWEQCLTSCAEVFGNEDPEQPHIETPEPEPGPNPPESQPVPVAPGPPPIPYIVLP